MKQELICKLSDRSAIIGVVGLGYVGIPLSISFSNSGFKVIGFDIDVAKTDAILAGKSYIKHIPDSDISDAVSKGKFVLSAYIYFEIHI